MTVWVDIENLPDVLFFSPLLKALRAQGHDVFVTARRERDLLELCQRKGWEIALAIGRHRRRGKLLKVAAGLARAVGLARKVPERGGDVLVNFASRPAILASALLRVPVFTFFDYEHVSLPLVGRLSRTICVPCAIPMSALDTHGMPETKILRLPGTKEEVYVHDFVPSPIRASLSIPEDEVLVLIRPPASTAHYHDPHSEQLYEALLRRVARTPRVHARVLSRTPNERERLESTYGKNGRIGHLDSTHDGLNLIWNSDLVVSGGGTMTREAAALGVPSYSMFTGAEGAVDRSLFETGKVVPVRNLHGMDTISLVRAPRRGSPPDERRDLVDVLVTGVTQTGR